jgi:hypothetical protein
MFLVHEGVAWLCGDAAFWGDFVSLVFMVFGFVLPTRGLSRVGCSVGIFDLVPENGAHWDAHRRAFRLSGTATMHIINILLDTAHGLLSLRIPGKCGLWVLSETELAKA